MQAKVVINAFQHEKKMPLCSMAWNPSWPTNKEIAFCDCKGYLGLIENATSQTANHQAKSAASLSEMASLDDDDAEISISQLKKETGFMMSKEDGHDVFTGVRPSASMSNRSTFANFTGLF